MVEVVEGVPNLGQSLALIGFSNLNFCERLFVDLIAAVEIAIVTNAALQRPRDRHDAK